MKKYSTLVFKVSIDWNLPGSDILSMRYAAHLLAIVVKEIIKRPDFKKIFINVSIMDSFFQNELSILREKKKKPTELLNSLPRALRTGPSEIFLLLTRTKNWCSSWFSVKVWKKNQTCIFFSNNKSTEFEIYTLVSQNYLWWGVSSIIPEFSSFSHATSFMEHDSKPLNFVLVFFLYIRDKLSYLAATYAMIYTVEADRFTISRFTNIKIEVHDLVGILDPPIHSSVWSILLTLFDFTTLVESSERHSTILWIYTSLSVKKGEKRLPKSSFCRPEWYPGSIIE